MNNPAGIPDVRWQRICQLDELPMGDARGFDPFGAGRITMFVVRTQEGIFAYRDLCPHYGTTGLAWKRDAYLTAKRDRIECSLHGAQFRIEDGACTIGACLGQSLDSIETVSADGGLWVAMSEAARLKS